MKWILQRQGSLLIGWFTKGGRDFVQSDSLIKVTCLLAEVITRDILVTEELVIVRSF